MTEVRSAAVVGLGLIGGSVARELTAGGVRVLGYDRDSDTLRAALHEGGIHAALGPGLEGIEEAEAMVIAVPVSAAPAVLRQACPLLGGVRLVTDVGSTKGTIVAAAEALGIGERFIGSHPLAGDHRSGWEFSRLGLFQGTRAYLCPGPSTSEATLALARGFWTDLGARPEIFAPAEHDRRVAWTSHLPQTASTALALALDSERITSAELGAGGQAMTRLSGSSPEMWTGIALDNAAALSRAIEAMEESLGAFRIALERRDAERIRRFFAAGREWFADCGAEEGRA